MLTPPVRVLVFVSVMLRTAPAQAQAQAQTQTQPAETVPAASAPRGGRSLLLAVVGSSILEAPVPMVGAEAGWNLSRWVAADLVVESGLRVTLAQAGGKLYLFDYPRSPYLFGRGGISLQSFNQVPLFWFCPGVGFEALTTNTIVLFAEAGPAFEWRNDRAGRNDLLMVSLGVGFRLDGQPRPHPVPLEPDGPPGANGEPCTPVRGMRGTYACQGGLVCREGRCVLSDSEL